MAARPHDVPFSLLFTLQSLGCWERHELTDPNLSGLWVGEGRWVIVRVAGRDRRIGGVWERWSLFHVPYIDRRALQALQITAKLWGPREAPKGAP